MNRDDRGQDARNRTWSPTIGETVSSNSSPTPVVGGVALPQGLVQALREVRGRIDDLCQQYETSREVLLRSCLVFTREDILVAATLHNYNAQHAGSQNTSFNGFSASNLFLGASLRNKNTPSHGVVDQRPGAPNINSPIFSPNLTTSTIREFPKAALQSPKQASPRPPSTQLQEDINYDNTYSTNMLLLSRSENSAMAEAHPNPPSGQGIVKNPQCNADGSAARPMEATDAENASQCSDFSSQGMNSVINGPRAPRREASSPLPDARGSFAALAGPSSLIVPDPGTRPPASLPLLPGPSAHMRPSPSTLSTPLAPANPITGPDTPATQAKTASNAAVVLQAPLPSPVTPFDYLAHISYDFVFGIEAEFLVVKSKTEMAIDTKTKALKDIIPRLNDAFKHIPFEQSGAVAPPAASDGSDSQRGIVFKYYDYQAARVDTDYTQWKLTTDTSIRNNISSFNNTTRIVEDAMRGLSPNFYCCPAPSPVQPQNRGSPTSTIAQMLNPTRQPISTIGTALPSSTASSLYSSTLQSTTNKTCFGLELISPKLRGPQGAVIATSIINFIQHSLRDNEVATNTTTAFHVHASLLKGDDQRDDNNIGGKHRQLQEQLAEQNGRIRRLCSYLIYYEPVLDRIMLPHRRGDYASHSRSNLKSVCLFQHSHRQAPKGTDGDNPDRGNGGPSPRGLTTGMNSVKSAIETVEASRVSRTILPLVRIMCPRLSSVKDSHRNHKVNLLPLLPPIHQAPAPGAAPPTGIFGAITGLSQAGPGRGTAIGGPLYFPIHMTYEGANKKKNSKISQASKYLTYPNKRIEFRHHHGTMDALEVGGWILLVYHLMSYGLNAPTPPPPPGASEDALPSLAQMLNTIAPDNKELREYYLLKEKVLHPEPGTSPPRHVSPLYSEPSAPSSYNNGHGHYEAREIYRDTAGEHCDSGLEDYNASSSGEEVAAKDRQRDEQTGSSSANQSLDSSKLAINTFPVGGGDTVRHNPLEPDSPQGEDGGRDRAEGVMTPAPPRDGPPTSASPRLRDNQPGFPRGPAENAGDKALGNAQMRTHLQLDSKGTNSPPNNSLSAQPSTNTSQCSYARGGSHLNTATNSATFEGSEVTDNTYGSILGLANPVDDKNGANPDSTSRWLASSSSSNERVLSPANNNANDNNKDNNNNKKNHNNNNNSSISTTSMTVSPQSNFVGIYPLSSGSSSGNPSGAPDDRSNISSNYFNNNSINETSKNMKNQPGNNSTGEHFVQSSMIGIYYNNVFTEPGRRAGKPTEGTNQNVAGKDEKAPQASEKGAALPDTSEMNHGDPAPRKKAKRLSCAQIKITKRQEKLLTLLPNYQGLTSQYYFNSHNFLFGQVLKNASSSLLPMRVSVQLNNSSFQMGNYSFTQQSSTPNISGGSGFFGSINYSVGAASGVKQLPLGMELVDKNTISTFVGAVLRAINRPRSRAGDLLDWRGSISSGATSGQNSQRASLSPGSARASLSPFHWAATGASNNSSITGALASSQNQPSIVLNAQNQVVLVNPTYATDLLTRLPYPITAVSIAGATLQETTVKATGPGAAHHKPFVINTINTSDSGGNPRGGNGGFSSLSTLAAALSAPEGDIFNNRTLLTNYNHSYFYPPPNPSGDAVAAEQVQPPPPPPPLLVRVTMDASGVLLPALASLLSWLLVAEKGLLQALQGEASNTLSFGGGGAKSPQRLPRKARAPGDEAGDARHINHVFNNYYHLNYEELIAGCSAKVSQDLIDEKEGNAGMGDKKVHSPVSQGGYTRNQSIYETYTTKNRAGTIGSAAGAAQANTLRQHYQRCVDTVFNPNGSTSYGPFIGNGNPLAAPPLLPLLPHLLPKRYADASLATVVKHIHRLITSAAPDDDDAAPGSHERALTLLPALQQIGFDGAAWVSLTRLLEYQVAPEGFCIVLTFLLPTEQLIGLRAANSGTSGTVTPNRRRRSVLNSNNDQLMSLNNNINKTNMKRRCSLFHKMANKSPQDTGILAGSGDSTVPLNKALKQLLAPRLRFLSYFFHFAVSSAGAGAPGRGDERLMQAAAYAQLLRGLPLDNLISEMVEYYDGCPPGSPGPHRLLQSPSNDNSSTSPGLTSDGNEADEADGMIIHEKESFIFRRLLAGVTPPT